MQPALRTTAAPRAVGFRCCGRNDRDLAGWAVISVYGTRGSAQPVSRMKSLASVFGRPPRHHLPSGRLAGRPCKPFCCDTIISYLEPPEWAGSFILPSKGVVPLDKEELPDIPVRIWFAGCGGGHKKIEPRLATRPSWERRNRTKSLWGNVSLLRGCPRRC